MLKKFLFFVKFAKTINVAFSFAEHKLEFVQIRKSYTSNFKHCFRQAI